MTARLRLIRHISLALLLIWVGLVAASFLRRQVERRPATGQIDMGAGETAPGQQPVRVHKGFVYTDTIGVEPNFRVAAEETVEFASGWFELHNVEVSLYHGGEVAYSLFAQQARLNRDRREAIATGDVRLTLGGGIAVHAAGFSLLGEERQLASQGPATFAGEGIGGLAGGLICRLADDSVDLVGGVSLVWREAGEDAPALVLLAPRVTYARRLARIEFPEGVTLLRGGLRLRGAQARLQLKQAEGALLSVEIDEPVELSAALADGTLVAGASGRLRIESLEDEQGRLRLTAEPEARSGWVRLRVQDPLQGWREMDAWRLVGEGSRSSWEWLEAQGLACITDFPADGEPRELTADRARLEFDGSRPSSAVADGNVRVASGEQWATGGRLLFSLRSRTFNLRPAANARVAVGTAEVECVCDQLESADGGNVVARGNVSGVLRRGALWGSADAPVRFAADSVLVTSTGARLTLDGQARLWQGDRLVRGDHLEFERESEVLEGRGNIVTLARLASQGETPGELVQLRARSLEYQHRGGLAVYEGDVVLEDSRSTANCQRLTVVLSDDGQVQLATLDGGITLKEKGTGRVIKGQTARMDTSKDVLEIWGTPVIVEEPGGNQVKGDKLEWRRASETLIVTGKEGSPSETIYHPPAPSPTPAPLRAPAPPPRRARVP